MDIRISDIVIDNFVTLFLMLGLSILIFANRTLDKRCNYYFLSFIAIVLLLDIVYMYDFYLSQFDSPSRLHYITSAIIATLKPASVAIIINILFRRKKFSLTLWIPVIFVAIISFTSYYTHLMFWFNSNNYLNRGPIGYVGHIISIIYGIILIVLTIKSYTSLDLGEVSLIFYIVSGCILAAYLQNKLSVRFLLPGALSASCSMYYIFIYIQIYKKDKLTNILNRRSLYADAEKMSNQKFAVILMDLNNLKYINDTYGHRAGDEALKAFANTCVSASKNKFTIYRSGGDEFIALGKNKSKKDVQEFINSIRITLNSKGYSASFGYEEYDGKESFDAICNKADINMYKDKMNYKHRENERK